MEDKANDWIRIGEGSSSSSSSSEEEVSKDGLVRLHCSAQDKVLYGVLNKIPVLFEVKTKEKPASNVEEGQQPKQRPSFNLAIVLDRSGSMAGDAFENAKAAVKKVIQNLKDQDVIHLVVYDTTVDVVFENESARMKEGLLGMVDELTTANCTNLCGGIQKAFDILKTSNKVMNKRIFLFSDGMANEGITNKEQIFSIVRNFHEHGVNITTFGIGASFDEALMKGIAEHGRGDYFFIEGADDIVNKVDKGMSVLTELLCRNAVLKLRGLNGGLVTRILSHSEESLIHGAQVGDISEDDLRQIIAEIEVRPDVTKDREELLEYELTYENPEDQSKETLRGKLSLGFTNHASEIVQNTSVQIALKIAESSDNDKAVLELVHDGKFKEAIKKKSSMIDQLKALEALDTSGLIKLIVARAEKTLQGMKEQKDVAKMQKDIDYDAHCASIVHRKCF